MPDTHLNACLELSSENLNKFNPQQHAASSSQTVKSGKLREKVGDHLVSYFKVRNIK